MALLELRDVNTYYGSIHALKNVSLKVEAGQIVTLIGSNGAGKTTTLRTISGLLRPRSGTITFNDSPIHNTPAHEIVYLGLTQSPEGRLIFPTLTVNENLNMGGYSLGNDKASVESHRQRVYDLFPRLAQRKKQLGGTLSGGEQQMLAIGRALMANPRLLMLDEPSLGLAPLLVRMIFETIETINQQGVTVLLVEQNARAALRLADYGYVLETGGIALEGPADELLHDQRVRHAYLGEA
ncbi:MAG: ABC transporter ATP-binding protein [Chloroflexi bacterium]|jgi:branched-chain amino acid transport system ATP-binding protein|nr:ABC transporter ATP-binding protein [Chloroflexota bacterium]